MNASELGEGSLKNFYGYKETFTRETTWMPVPRELKFVHTNNPYEDDEDGGYADGDTSFMTDMSERYEEGHGRSDYEFARELAQAAYPAYATHGLEALSAVASQDQYSYAPPPAPMTSAEHSPHQQFPTANPQQSHAPASQNLDFILNPTSSGAAVSPSNNSNIDPRLHSETPVSEEPGPSHRHVQSSERVRTSSATPFGQPRLHFKGPNGSGGRRAAIENPQLAFLLRDFSERAGMWMDLFDLKLFFATTVPVLAVDSPLLLYSCAALSAKSLARVAGRKPTMSGQIEEARRSSMEHWAGLELDVEGWYQKAREYYDLAVSLLRQALSGDSRPPTSSLPQHTSPSTISNAQSIQLPTTDSDELVAATAILCVYEFLDASAQEWSRHLDGAKSLFDIANDRMVQLTIRTSPPPISPTSLPQPGRATIRGEEYPLSIGRRAVFWNFARQDMLSALINSTSTRLDTADLAMWQSAGIKLTHEGYVCPSNRSHANFDSNNYMDDDMICNALIWLLAKLVNFITAGDDVPSTISPLGLGVRQKELLNYWEQLDEQFNAWFDGLPDSFRAIAVISPNAEDGSEEMWFPRPMCASAMQWYHFAKIQLLHNKPHLTTATRDLPSTHSSPGPVAPGVSLAARHASYAAILKSSRKHAKDIVTIALGRSDEGTIIHSVQPLWTAGLVLGTSQHDEEIDAETWMWRRKIISQLRGIERDTGWASEYRIKSLLELWSLPADWDASIPT